MGFNPVDLAFGNMNALRSGNERLRAENAKLRHDLEEANNQAEEVCIENAKLRELVAEIYEDQCDNSERWRYRDRMRELGIEVDG